MREQLLAAARACRAEVLSGGARQLKEIRKIAFEVGRQLDRNVQVDEKGNDVVVTFAARVTEWP